MHKALKQNEIKVRGGLAPLAVLALAMVVIAFGCTTYRYPDTGEPVSYVSPAGTMTPTVVTMPGTVHSAPATMISSSVDAIAILRANEGFEGKVLGPANPAPRSAAMQQPMYVSGQVIPAPVYTGPMTLNSSINSPGGFPAIVSGAGEPLGGVTGGVVPTPGGVATTGSAVTSTIIGSGMATGPATFGTLISTPSAASTVPLTTIGTGGGVIIAPAANVGLTSTAALTTVGSVGRQGPVRAVTGSNGAVTFTNLPTQTTRVSTTNP